MNYAELADVYETLERASGRLEKTAVLARLLKKTPEDDLDGMVLLLQGRIYPAYDAREIGVAEKLMVRALMSALGVSEREVHADWKRTGDLGSAAEHFVTRKKQRTLAQQQLTVRKVFCNIRMIAEESGAGSVERKIARIAEMLTSSTPSEARYIVRTVLEDLRVGVGAGTIRDAIVWAYLPLVKGLFPEREAEEKKCRNILKAESVSDMKRLGACDCIEADQKTAREIYNSCAQAVQEAYDLTNDFAIVAKAAKESRLRGLADIAMRMGTPVKAMLALKADTIRAAFEAVGKPAEVEYKFDGFRMQIHKQGGDVRIFTRRLDDVTAQFPEVVEHIRNHVHAASCVLDAEAVGFDPKTKCYLPFQHVSQRIRRKYDINKLSAELPVEVNVFDIIAHNGRSVITKPFVERRKLIEQLVDVKPRSILPAKKLVTESEEAVKQFFAESKAKGNEGIMFKKLEAPYRPGARVGHMLKYKQTMESLDVVITGAEWGEGKRAKWLSSYDIACRKDGAFVGIGKVATGMKEKASEGLSFGEMTALLKPLIVSETGKHAQLRPRTVIEVAYEEIQKSPTYASGYALRFPRVLRLRSDKGPQDVTSLKLVEQFYAGQRFGK